MLESVVRGTAHIALPANITNQYLFQGWLTTYFEMAFLAKFSLVVRLFQYFTSTVSIDLLTSNVNIISTPETFVLIVFSHHLRWNIPNNNIIKLQIKKMYFRIFIFLSKKLYSSINLFFLL